MLQPEILEKEQAIMPMLRLAFRPFFLLPALLSIIAVVVWLSVLMGKLQWQAILPANLWHGHEMIFGFAASVAVGFLLTAAQTWTGVRSINGWKLASLIVLWLIARIALFSPTEFGLIIAIVSEGLWWLAAISYLAYMVVKSNNQRNLIFVPLLTLMMTLDLGSLLLVLIGEAVLASHLVFSAVFMMTLIVTILGGRVIPFFTYRALDLPTIEAKARLERTLIPLMLCAFILFIVSYFFPMQKVLAGVMILAGFTHIARIANWQTGKTLTTPLLWSLHLSYLNMAIGLIAVGASYFSNAVSFSSAIHIITVGTLGTMILAMMSRVSLGHTGRALQINAWVSFAFLLLLLATVIRFLLPVFNFILPGYLAATLLWTLGFGIFIFYYTPMLLQARPDGRSG